MTPKGFQGNLEALFISHPARFITCTNLAFTRQSDLILLAMPRTLLILNLCFTCFS
jgi:hypothetical protein